MRQGSVTAAAGPRVRGRPRALPKTTRVKLCILALALGIVCAGLPVQAATYSGVAAVPSVVWLTADPPAAAPDASMRQTQKAFVPQVLVVPIGTTVHFPNDDKFYHSVYSDSPSNPFDLGLYDTGPGKAVVFENTGVVEIRCHVHGSMHATVVVVNGPYVVTTHPNERFHIDGVPSGPRALHVWTDGTNVTTSYITLK
jgi:plastocyanin